MITLYGAGRSRWVKPYWTLKELDVPFETVIVRPARVEQDHPDFLAVNPFAKIPALKDDKFVIYESAAICTYLADKYPEKGLIPRAGTYARAQYNQWISFIISELEQPLWCITKHKYLYDVNQHSEHAIEVAKREFDKIISILDAQISDYLVDDNFSIADIAMTYTLNWASGFEMLPQGTKLAAYAANHSSRSAFPKELYK